MFKHRIQSLSDLVDMLSRVPINCHVMMIFEFSPLPLRVLPEKPELGITPKHGIKR